jgi:branched-chain amino acid transport system permease protein
MLLGFVFIFIVMFVPGGLVPGFRRALQRLRRRPSDDGQPAAVMARPARPLKEAR